MRLLVRYFLREFFSIFLFSILFFSSLLLLDKIIDYAGFIFTNTFTLVKFFRFIVKTLLSILVFTLPLAWLSGVVLASGRMAGDWEFLAMEASGIDLKRLFLPFLLFSLAVSLFMCRYTARWAPEFLYESKKIVYEILTEPFLSLEEKTFNQLGGYVLFFSERNKTRLKDVVIYQKEKEDTQVLITAVQASFFRDGELLHFVLEDGIYQKRDFRNPGKTHLVEFRKYFFPVLLSRGKKDLQRRWRELTSGKLLKEIRDLKQQNLPVHQPFFEYYSRYNFSLSVFVFTLLSLPLALRMRLKKKASGYGMAILLIFIYYLIFIGGSNMIKGGNFPPWAAAFLPDAVFFLAGSFLYLCI